MVAAAEDGGCEHATGEITRAAVLGAGVMGAQIAALLANAGCRVDLLDLPGDTRQSDHASAGLARALKARPPAFFVPEMAELVSTGSFEDLSVLQEADWIIEAIVEDLSAKRALYERIETAASPSAIISTNTSGLSVAKLSEGRSESFRSRFLAAHFFNPPRYMKLVEIVPGSATSPIATARLSHFIEEALGKGVVLCRDTPNFIANRLGVFAIMDVLHRMERDGLTVEEVDAVTGELIGRPRSATLRLCDLIGLDILVNVATTARDNLPDDDNRHVFDAPPFVKSMLEADLLGAKREAGFYRKEGGVIQALDVHSLQFRDPERGALSGKLAEAVSTRDPGQRLRTLWADDSRLGLFVRNHIVATLAYTARIAGDIASGVSQIDRAMRLGFNWQFGPFQMIDALGVQRLTAGLEEGGLVVPALLRDSLSAQRVFYVPAANDGEAAELSYAFEAGSHISVQRTPDDGDLLARSVVVDESEGARLLRIEKDAGVLLFRGRMNVIGHSTLELVRRAVEDDSFTTLVLYGDGEMFSAGADLKFIMSLIEASNWHELERYVKAFQQATMAVRFSARPVIAAPRGFALGGGCEFCLAAAARVASADLQIGLVETGVGLVPAAGGCKEMVRRCGAEIGPAFEVLFAGDFSDNAHHALQRGFLETADQVIMADDRILQRAIKVGRQLASEGYAAPKEMSLQVAGHQIMAEIEELLESQVASADITAHDRIVGIALARVLCGAGAGGERAHSVREGDLLDLECEVFLELSGMEATRQRIEHMLSTGKRLRN